MIKQYALTALQKATHLALQLDESMPKKIAALNGRTLHIIIKPLQLGFYILFINGEMTFLEDYDGTVDTTIESSPLGLIRLSLLPSSKVRSLFNDQIQISGDVELGQQVKQLFDELDIDWEGHLAQFTGDAIAHQFGSMVRKGMAFTQHFHQSMRENLTGFLQEESRTFPSREEVHDFFNDVDTLTMDVERLAARVENLIKQDNANHESH